jgi:hypothetical protein
MSERQATLHDERMRDPAAQVVDLRGRLAAAEAERDAARETIAHYQADVANNYKLMSLYQEQRDMWMQEAERRSGALGELIEHIERLFGDVTHPSMAVRALRTHARAALDGKP